MTDRTLLRPGEKFPALTAALPGNRTLRLPDDLAGRLSVVLFYRGSWYRYCNAQLRAFQRSLGALAGLDVMVAALSVDDEATTQGLIARHGLRFPVGHSADADEGGERGPRMAAVHRSTRSEAGTIGPAGRAGGGPRAPEVR